MPATTSSSSAAADASIANTPDPADAGLAGVDAPASDAKEDMLLVQRCQAGDTSAYEGLVNRHRGRVYAMTYNLTGNESDAWDLSQEVFIKAWRALPKFEGKSSFFTWLYRITHNVVYDFMRKKRITATGVEFDDSESLVAVAAGATTLPSTQTAPDTRLENKELGDRLKAALAKLSPEHQSAILAKEIDGLSYQEIADAQGITLGTVMSRLFYARQKLQSLLADLAPNRRPA